MADALPLGQWGGKCEERGRKRCREWCACVCVCWVRELCRGVCEHISAVTYAHWVAVKPLPAVANHGLVACSQLITQPIKKYQCSWWTAEICPIMVQYSGGLQEHTDTTLSHRHHPISLTPPYLIDTPYLIDSSLPLWYALSHRHHLSHWHCPISMTPPYLTDTTSSPTPPYLTDTSLSHRYHPISLTPSCLTPYLTDFALSRWHHPISLILPYLTNAALSHGHHLISHPIWLTPAMPLTPSYLIAVHLTNSAVRCTPLCLSVSLLFSSLWSKHVPLFVDGILAVSHVHFLMKRKHQQNSNCTSIQQLSFTYNYCGFDCESRATIKWSFSNRLPAPALLSKHV